VPVVRFPSRVHRLGLLWLFENELTMVGGAREIAARC
jgi:hypothetical protein